MTRPAPATVDKLDAERRREVVTLVRGGFAARNRGESVRFLTPADRQGARLMIRCAELSVRRLGVRLAELPEKPSEDAVIGWAYDEAERVLVQLRDLYDRMRQLRAELDLAEWMAQQEGLLPMRDPATGQTCRKGRA